MQARDSTTNSNPTTPKHYNTRAKTISKRVWQSCLKRPEESFVSLYSLLIWNFLLLLVVVVFFFLPSNATILIKPLIVVPNTWKDTFKMYVFTLVLCVFTLVLWFLKFQVQGPLTLLPSAWNVAETLEVVHWRERVVGRHTGKGEQWRGRERCAEMKWRETEIERKGPWKKYFFPGPFSSDSLPPTRT